MMLDDAWALLRDAEPAARDASALRIRLVESTAHCRIYVSMRGHSGEIGVVVEVAGTTIDPRRMPPRVKRVRVSVLDGEVSHLPGGSHAMLVELTDGSYAELFVHFAQAIVRAAVFADSPSAAARSVLTEIGHWVRFMDRSEPLLTESEAKGLFGELVVLERLCERIAPSEALDAWLAPGGSLRDFESDRFAIEVKSFSSSGGGVVWVNDPMQLEPDPGIPLFLACVQLASSDDPSDSLLQRAERLAGVFSDDPMSLDRYWLLLASAGLPRGCDESLIGPCRWRLGTVQLFHVSDTFPRLLAEQMPFGVSHVRFAINVNALGPYLVPRGGSAGAADDWWTA